MIRTIHPLYLLGLMAVLFFTLIWQNTKVESEIAYDRSERANARVMAQRIVELKKVMKTVDRRQIDLFLDGALFADAELTHRVKGERYIIDAKHMDARQLQSFLNRILNMSVNIVQLKVQRKDEKYTSMYMEISL